RQGLARSSASIGGAIADLVTKRRLDAAVLEELEDVLIRADLGVAAAGRIVAAVRAGRYEQTVAADEGKAILAGEIEKGLEPGGRNGEGAGAGGAAACARRRQAVRYSGGRRQRIGQDHDHR